MSQGWSLGGTRSPPAPPSPSAPSPRGCGGVEAPGEAAAAAAQELSARLLGLAAQPAPEPDPSVYLALRLAPHHDLAGEQRYLARLRDAFQHRYGRYVPLGPPGPLLHR